MMKDKLPEGSEILFRQVHPSFIDNGIPASDRFRPSARDQNMLSVDRSAIVTAEQSHTNYCAAGLASAAVFGLTVSEFTEENISCTEDPIEETAETPANPAHALADYSSHDPKNQKLIAKRLQRVAIARGRLHPPADQA